ncbi:MAG: redox-sensing transcriptional repressor Rex [bacterium]
MAEETRSRKRRHPPPSRTKASGQGKKAAGPAGDFSLLKEKIPEAAIRRLSTYQQILNQLGEEGIPVASSAELAGRCGVNPAQVRKDLAYFGGFGIRGKGYYVKDLRENLKKILGVTTIQKVALVGAGNLGSALLAHKEFLSHGFVIDAVFDKFPKSAQPRKGGGPPVMSMSKLGAVVRARKIEIGIVAVPGEGAQGVVTRLVEAGVRGILNFAPVQVSAPPGVKIKNVDLASELEHLSYHLSISEED